MKHLLIVLLVFISFFALGQQKLFVNAKIIVINPMDTLYRSVICRGHLYKPDKIDESFFTHGVNYYENGKRVGISSSRIKSFEYIDSTRILKNRKFVNSRLAYSWVNKELRPYERYSTLFEEITIGKICWYVTYLSGPVSGSTTVVNIFIKDGETDNGKVFISLKKRLMNLLSDQPELVKEIKKTKFSRKPAEYQPQVLNFLTKYNELYNK